MLCKARQGIISGLTLWILNKMSYSPDDIFKRIFFEENFFICIEIWLQFVPKGQDDNKLALAWWQQGDRSLLEPVIHHAFLIGWLPYQWSALTLMKVLQHTCNFYVSGIYGYLFIHKINLNDKMTALPR